jgi:transcriptional regulator GlxA family with amidase domain
MQTLIPPLATWPFQLPLSVSAVKSILGAIPSAVLNKTEIDRYISDMNETPSQRLDAEAGSGKHVYVPPDLRVGFVLAPKFTLIAFASFIDCLRHAADEADRSRQIHCQWSVIAPSEGSVEASCGMLVTPGVGLPEPAELDYVVVVGGLLPDCLALSAATYEYLRTAYSAGISVIGICTGGFILAEAGLLDDRECAVHIDHRHQLDEMFPAVHPVTDRSFVRDRGILTCPGGTAAIDLAYALIEEHCGRARAVKSLMSLLVEKQRAAHQMSARPYQELTACGDWRVEKAVELMERYALDPFSIRELAQRIGSSTRGLNRSFAKIAGVAPGAIWRKIRLTHAHWMLLNTHRNVTEIALECGFADLAHFSRWFRVEYGEAPAAFRRLRRVASTQHYSGD